LSGFQAASVTQGPGWLFGQVVFVPVEAGLRVAA
jgi:hypothetical protein